jgi:sugar phosphate isomerase/epimerase
MKSVIAAQLFTIRHSTQTEEALAESLSKIRQIGYRAVQVSGIGPISNEAVKRIVDDLGLTICITHTAYDPLWNRTQEVIEQHLQWECKHVAIGSLPMEYRENEAGYHRFATEATRVGEKLASAGLTFSYHNHSFEFVRFGDRTGLDIIFEESDPRYLQAELDTYWIQHGGGSPANWIRRMKNRMPVVHLKDMAVVPDGWNVQQMMAEVGSGNLDWPDILAACREAGIEWYAVEQDVTPGDPFESLEISYRNLLALGVDRTNP